MTPGQLLQKLNAEPIDNVTQFISEAANMPKQPNGQYAVSLPTDSPKLVGTHVVWELLDEGRKFETHLPNQADSLRQLKYWADYLFGQNKVG
jgi:hypothetical protein